MPDTRTPHLNMYVIGSPSDNVGGHMITNYNYNISLLDTYIAQHALETMTLANGILTITSLDGTTYTASIQGAVSGIVADIFDPAVPVASGELVIYNGDLYECTTSHSGAWDPAHFSQTTIAALLSQLENALGNKADKVTTATADNLAAFDASGNIKDSGIPGAIDATPTSGSDNLVKSGGVYSAVKTVQDNLDKLGLSVVDGKLCVTYSTS